MLKVDQNGTSQKISAGYVLKVLKIHSFQRRFRLVCSPPPVRIEGWWANVPTSFHQNESRLNRKITHLRPVRFDAFPFGQFTSSTTWWFFFPPTCILHSKYYHLGRIHDLFFQTTKFFGNVASGNSCIQTSTFPVHFWALFVQLFVNKSDPKYWSNVVSAKGQEGRFLPTFRLQNPCISSSIVGFMSGAF